MSITSGLITLAAITVAFFLSRFFTNKLIKLLLQTLQQRKLHIKSILSIHGEHVTSYQKSIDSYNKQIQSLKEHVARLKEINYNSRLRRRNRYWRTLNN